MKLFVNNLAWKTTDDELRNHFAQVGPVVEAKVIMDRQTGKARGFGFVTMADQHAETAIKTLNETSLCGRSIFVAEAKERERTQSRPYDRR